MIESVFTIQTLKDIHIVKSVLISNGRFVFHRGYFTEGVLLTNNKYKSVKIILWVILFANFMVAFIKIGVGISSKSQSVIADGIHSMADGASNIVGLIGTWLASKPRDTKHPYGHGKFEIIASMFIGVMLAIMSVRIISRAIMSFQNPVILEIDRLKALLMIFTIIVNIIVAVSEYKSGKRLQSTILITDSLHTRGDILISCAVLLGLIGIKAGIPARLDGILSVLVAIAVLVSAWQIIKNCVDVLVDSAVVDSNEVKKLLMTVPGIYDVHQIRSRGEFSHVFIDLHVIVSPQENILNTHGMSHRLEDILKEHFGSDTEVTIHMEPDDGRHNT